MGDLPAVRRAVTEHRRAQAAAGVAKARWLRAHRGVPVTAIYHQDGTPKDPELASLEAALAQAAADVEWCRAVEVAVAEEVKGEPFEVVVARNEANRQKAMSTRNKAVG